MTDPNPRGQNLLPRWILSLLLCAGLLGSVVLALEARTTPAGIEDGNDVRPHLNAVAPQGELLDELDLASRETRPDTNAAFDERSGQTVLRLRGACADVSRCVGSTSETSGFFLNATAGGGLFTVSWRAVNDSLRTLRVNVSGVIVEGESPLRVEMAGLVAGEHTVRVEPAGRVAGVYDQLVEWTASFAPTDPPRSILTRGWSSYDAPACALETCPELARHTSDALVVPWRARGTLTAEWSGGGALRVTIPGTGFAAEGGSPLTMDVSGLTAGQWRVQVDPSFAIASDATILWTAALAPE